MMKPSLPSLALAGTLLAGTASAASAADISLVAHLLGGSEVPATPSDAFAEAQFTYDSSTRALQYYVNYDGVAPARLALHGPAAAGEKAAAIADLPLSDSPISGTVTLTAAQGEELLAGKIYLDIQSQKYPDGEIRGQIVK